jgi:hypothetical protein
MRQGKLSELIHHSAGHEHIESCSVEVWFREIVDTVSPASESRYHVRLGLISRFLLAWSRRISSRSRISACGR